MTKGGRPPTPEKLHVLRGTARPDRRRGIPQPEPVAPTCPKWLLPAARREWRRVAPELTKLGLLTRLDRAALAAYCQAWGHYVAAEQALARDGIVIEGHRAVLRKHPAATLSGQAVAQMRAWCCEFGMTPTSRGRMSLPAPDSPDDLEDFLNE